MEEIAIDCKTEYALNVIAVCYVRGVRYEPGSNVTVYSKEARDHLTRQGAATVVETLQQAAEQVAVPRVKRTTSRR